MRTARKNVLISLYHYAFTMNRDINIIFMGTPEFAVASLKHTVEAGYRVSAVVTVPDKPAGRGLKLKQSAVKEYALEQGLPVLQPQNLSDPEFIGQIKSYGANLFIVVAFRKLPEVLWSLPSLGCFNLHASLLPQYRGAAPINHALINGESVTGITTFFINAGIDTGKILLQESVEAGPDETAGELHDKLKEAGAALVVKTIACIAESKCKPVPQPEVRGAVKTAPRIFREHCIINWNRPASEVHNLIRGLSPYPGAIAFLGEGKNQREAKILRTTQSHEACDIPPGHTRIISGNRLLVACNDYFLELITLQPAGKKAMPTPDFLRGFRDEKLIFKATPEAV